MAKSPTASLFPTSGSVPPGFHISTVDQREWLLAGELRSWEGPLQEARSPVCLRQPGGSLERFLVGRTPLLDGDAALAALAAAEAAWDGGRGHWPTLPVAARIEAVERFAFLMKEKRDEVARLLMWEVGKTWDDSLREFDRTLAYIRDTVESLKELDRASSRFAVAAGIFAQIRRAPLGVVLCMGPFNYPLNETFTTLIPALIMGNAVVFKPPKLGVLLFRPLLEALRDSFPPGVVNVVYGDGRTVVGPLMTSGRVDVLAFIGTSAVADILKKQHPRPHRLRCVLGLDAKNPAIILPDADLELAVDECLLGSLSFNGQRCTALKILFVHEKLRGPFLERLVRGLEAWRLGMPWQDGARITPLPEDGKPAHLAELVSDALAHGARVVNPGGGETAATIFRPAVVAPVNARTRLWHEEQFGPVVPVTFFSDVSEPLDYIVRSPFGQQVSVFGGDPPAVGALIDTLVNQVCRVNLNSQCQRGPDEFPFTGRKDSAEGTLSVSDALRVFSIRSLVAAKGNDPNKTLLSAILRERRSRWLSTDFVF